MQVLVTGAQGFIGAALCRALARQGHVVVGGVHRAAIGDASAARAHGGAEPLPLARSIAVDFVRDVSPAVWLPRLAGIDAVVNTVGRLRAHGPATLQRVHVEAAVALFDACAQRGIARVVQLSALGADAQARSAYHRTKRAADDALLSRIPTAWCAQPSLGFGARGGSARLFLMLASLPLVPLPGDGTQRVQPIHLDDLVSALCVLLERDGGGRVALVGPAPLALRDYLFALRADLGLPRTVALPVPWTLVRLAAAASAWLPHALLDPATLGMLARGNTADPRDITALLGAPPRRVDAFVAAPDAPALRTAARLAWLLPLLRGSVALVWIVTGLVSLGLYPVEASYSLLARTGVPAAVAPLLLYGAAALDLVLGVLVFRLRGARRRLLWRAQVALILLYSVIIAWRLPEFWLHPYGPMLKNLPLVAVLVLLDVLEPDA
jgi:uncharacterized protein YbjT (DUF2867 family)